MKNNRWIFIGILSFIILAVGAYFWANAQMDTLYAYRSLLRDTPPTPGESFSWAQDEPITQRVIFILVDSLNNDTSHNAEVMPYINELRAQGAWAKSHSQPPSYSAPGYSTLSIGAWPHLNDGPALNLEYEEIPTWTQDNLFSAAHRAGLKTAVSAYDWFEKLIPQSDVDASYYTAEYDAAADVNVVNAALPWIESGEYQFVFIHLDQVDTAGHEFGAESPEWDAAATRVDDHIREIVSLLDLELDTVFITSDHGQIDIGGHGGDEEIVLTEPFVLVGAGVNPGEYPDTQMIDIAPTLAALLGTNIPATTQGHVLFDMLTFSSEQKAAVEAALDKQKRLLHNLYSDVIGDPLPIREDMGVVDGTNFAIDAMLIQQQDKERQMRFNLPIFLGIIPAYLIFRSWKKVKWHFGGAIIYVVLFNFRYAILEHKPYSLSAVTSVNDLILFNAITAAIVMSLVWLIVMLKLENFKNGSRNAAENTILLVAFTLYLWALPVLWNYAVNGFVVTWYLPDFPVMFRGFLALIQILMISLVGIVLTGVAALVAKRTAN